MGITCFVSIFSAAGGKYTLKAVFLADGEENSKNAD